MPTHLKRLTALILAMMLCMATGLPALSEPALQPLPIDLTPGHKPNKANYLPDQGGYEDASISVRIHKDQAYDSNILYAHIKIKHPSQIRTAPASTWIHQGNRQAATIAKRYHAVIAMNGDFFQFNNERYIVRQGKRLRNRPTGEDLLFIDSAGDFHVAHLARKEQITEVNDAVAALGRTVINCFSFGPILVEQGQPVFMEKTDYFNAAARKKTQRAILAQLGPLEYLIVSTEGPEDPGSKGLTLVEAAQYTADIARTLVPTGALYAYNMDGGSSNSLVLNYEKINSPKNPKKRAVSDIIYFASLVP
jgi:exopolysaccharide biosynthesis protein